MSKFLSAILFFIDLKAYSEICETEVFRRSLDCKRLDRRINLDLAVRLILKQSVMICTTSSLIRIRMSSGKTGLIYSRHSWNP